MEASNKPSFLTQQENVADLTARIAPGDLPLYSSLRYIYSDAAFFNRRFVIVKTHGVHGNGEPIKPTIEGSIRVIDFKCDHETGSHLTLMNESSSRTLQVGHVPIRLFRFPLFVSVPVYQGVKWEAKELQGSGNLVRRLVFGICFKQMSNVKFYEPNAVAILTPNEYRKHFGGDPPRF